MPMYDFHCSACGHEFEQITASDEASPQCPACSSDKTQRLLSTPLHKTNPMPFKVGPVRPTVPSGPQGGCAGGG